MSNSFRQVMCPECGERSLAVKTTVIFSFNGELDVLEDGVDMNFEINEMFATAGTGSPTIRYGDFKCKSCGKVLSNRRYELVFDENGENGELKVKLPAKRALYPQKRENDLYMVIPP